MFVSSLNESALNLMFPFDPKPGLFEKPMFGLFPKLLPLNTFDVEKFVFDAGFCPKTVLLLVKLLGFPNDGIGLLFAEKLVELDVNGPGLFGVFHIFPPNAGAGLFANPGFALNPVEVGKPETVGLEIPEFVIKPPEKFVGAWPKPVFPMTGGGFAVLFPINP